MGEFSYALFGGDPFGKKVVPKTNHRLVKRSLMVEV
jgi:hypothetical protein